jgi:hypothetical protein
MLREGRPAQPTFTCTHAFGDRTLACYSGSSAGCNGTPLLDGDRRDIGIVGHFWVSKATDRCGRRIQRATAAVAGQLLLQPPQLCLSDCRENVADVCKTT